MKQIDNNKVCSEEWNAGYQPSKPKSKRKFKTLWIVLGLSALFITGFVSGGVVKTLYDEAERKSQNVAIEDEKDKLKEAQKILSDEWYYSEGDKSLYDNAIRGMTYSKEDSHTQYLTAKEGKQLFGSLSNDFVGIGVMYRQDGDYFVITDVLENSPAKKAGIKPGSILKEVDGVDAKGLSTDKLSELIKGEKGEKVVVTLELPDGRVKDYSVIRDEVDNSVVSSVDGDTGILKLTTFGEDTASSVEDNVIAMKKEGVDKLIIDLRDNGGGYVDTAVKIASLFLEKGTPVLYEKDRDGKLKAVDALYDDPYTFDKVVILVNGNTASASEVLTLALKENLDNCEIVGTQTYGKGTMQHTKEFSDGSMLKYTVAEWLSSHKKSINGKGIKPDVEVELDPALTFAIDQIEKDKQYKLDQVGKNIEFVQKSLKFMGYQVDRTDGYYDKSTLEAIKKFEKDQKMKVTDGTIDDELIKKVTSAVQVYWADNQDKVDAQLNKAKACLKAKEE